MTGKVTLVKENELHTRNLQIGLAHRFFKIAYVRKKEGTEGNFYSFSFWIIHCKCFLNIATEYSSLTFGIRTME